jgi:hypothetical protein
VSSNNIIRVISALNVEITNYVIAGSKAFQLHKIDEDKECKDIDIIIEGNELPNGWNPLDSKFNRRRACKNIEGQLVECWLLDKLPEYNLIEVDGISVKVKSLRSLMYFYLSLNIEKTNRKFQDKIQKRKDWAEQYIRKFQ